MILDLRSFILGLVIAYLFLIITELFIFSICMAAGRKCPLPDIDDYGPVLNKTELDRLEEVSRARIKIINTES